MKYLVSFFIILLASLVILVAVTAILPSQILVSRGIYIKAEQKSIFEFTNSLKNWEKWSPWYNMDPNGNWKYSDNEYGVGSKISWNSKNKSLGEGSIKIIKSIPYSIIKLKLVLPGKKACRSIISFEKRMAQTKVTWEINIRYTFFERWLDFSTDKIIGTVLEDGLKKLKRAVE